MRRLLIISLICTGCGWKPKPYTRDPMGRLPPRDPAPATLEPITPGWPEPPAPPNSPRANLNS